MVAVRSFDTPPDPEPLIDALRTRFGSDRTDQANVRLDWIHTPGSDLFLVFDTGYFRGDLDDPRDERWLRRTGVVKLTYLKAF